jgi:hypothetical protein
LRKSVPAVNVHSFFSSIILAVSGDMSQLPSNPFLDRFLGGMPRDVADSFTPEQLLAVQRAFGMRYAVTHAVDLRRSVRLLGRRFYVVLLCGRDRPGDAPPPRSLLPAGLAAAALSVAALLLLR